MLQNNYFYVIDRDKQIFEIKYTQERIAAAVSAMRDKGLFTVEGLGIVLNGVDITKVLNEDQYSNYLSTVKPSEYILNGSWFKKNGDFVRYEPWKKAVKDKEKMMIESPKEAELTPESIERATAIGRAFLEKIRPNKKI